MAPALQNNASARLLADCLLPQRGRVLALTALIVASIAARLITPQLLRWFIDAVALGDDIRTDAG